jgi:hypothetical protein
MSIPGTYLFLKQKGKNMFKGLTLSLSIITGMIVGAPYLIILAIE